MVKRMLISCGHPLYTFQNEDIVLPEHHKMMHGRIKIKGHVVIVFQIIFDGHQQAFFVKQGRNRNEILLDNIDYHMTMIDEARSKTESDEYNRILTYFSNSANKSSAVEQKDHQVTFQ